MKRFLLLLLFAAFGLQKISAQLTTTPYTTAQALAQKLTGAGVTVTNVTFTGNPLMTGIFYNSNNLTNIGLDSGVVLTTGRAATSGGFIGISGNGIDPAQTPLASENWGLPGDNQLAIASGNPASSLRDACILEFDFTPLGDTIKFDYVFSSEEYDPAFVCTYNDAFAFFISGPGIVGSQNIALVPNSTTPVTIKNVNDVLGGACPLNMAYFVDNINNTRFTHDGHTTILSATSQVQPCQTYHLKLVIADVGDDAFDSGVFLKAGSLSSNAYTIQNVTQFDPTLGNSYLVEGCVPGFIKISRTQATGNAQQINLAYGGTALNTIDVQTLPPFITIAPDSTNAYLNINPIIDNIAEGVEVLKIYTLAPCAAVGSPPTDSTELQIRDFDILVLNPDTAYACRNTPVQFNATPTYTTYAWDPNPTLSSLTIPNPTATPVNHQTTYYCTAIIGTCNARDSVYLRLKDIEQDSKTEVLCAGASSGEVTVSPGFEWQAPVQFQLNNGSFQSDSTFSNLPVGTYFIKVQDASGCLDSIQVNIGLLHDTLAYSFTTQNANCDGVANGAIDITATGGLAPYRYVLNGGTAQSSPHFDVDQGTYTVTVIDTNNCSATQTVVVNYTNDLSLATGADPTICESKSTTISASGTANSYAWTPVATLTGANTATPTANPVTTTTYYVTATKGVCQLTDSVTVFVNAAPIPNAGIETSVCYGGRITLQGNGGTQYTWTPSTYLVNANVQNPQVVRPLNNITYTLSVVDANGCNSLVTDDILLKVTPGVVIFAGRDTVVAIGQPIQLNAVELNNSGVTSWVWNPAYGLSNPNINNPIATLDRDITYGVTGITNDFCEGTDSLVIKVYKGPNIYVPGAFTPNGDGRNDILRAIAVGMKETKYFTVFNRWGQKVFHTTDFRRGWDGRIKGQPQAMASYVWIAEAVDYTGKVHQVKGTFILMR